MSITDLFEQTHHSIQEEDLIPLSKVRGVVDPSGELSDYFGLDFSFLYFSPNSLPNIVYWNEYVWVDLWSNVVEILETTKVKDTIAHFTKQMEEFKIENGYSSIFSFLDKKPLLMIFLKYFNDIPMEQRYDVFRAIYHRLEYGFHMINDEVWDQLSVLRQYSDNWKVSLGLLHKEHGEEIRIYRGSNSKSAPLNKAWSWTTSKEVAQFFATRFSSNGVIYETSIPINKVFDYLPNRGEAEILVSPQHIDLVQEEHVVKTTKRT
ncbi:metal-dependent phosphohydrolase (plasmid) [Paenibacillus thiaminolyticus]|uniref:metal-dependent phosphohydrolase n=1 Tax=Paenibacillus thiaminolyticus TaxID=49283 RepID=UPI0023311205|nr:metal-dependent phosphohydrolase [Paenibacillus thiaminolyticus]WCF11649.1 metal-dependent phosphohydrolase [Paenibacillus thiaminolyticus]